MINESPKKKSMKRSKKGKSKTPEVRNTKEDLRLEDYESAID